MIEPACPKCGNNRQVWTDEHDGVTRCHRAYCENAFQPIIRTLSDDGDMFEVVAPQEKVSVLHEAYNLTRGERNSDYGHPLDDFGKTAKMWSGIFGVEVSAEQVALAMACVKISRELNKPKRDNLVDACGYFSTIEMIQEERERRSK